MNPNKITKHSLFKRSVYTEIIINAPIEKVWKELTNFKEMPNWSNGLQNIEGEFKKDGNAQVYFINNKGKVVLYRHKLIHFEEGKLFGWSDSFLLGIKDNHQYQLEGVSSTKTKFIQSDEANGFAAIIFGSAITNFMLTNYIAFNNLLKKRVEAV